MKPIRIEAIGIAYGRLDGEVLVSLDPHKSLPWQESGVMRLYCPNGSFNRLYQKKFKIVIEEVIEDSDIRHGAESGASNAPWIRGL